MDTATSAALLLKAPSYRAFLGAYFEASRSGGARLSYSAFARKAGFAARSYPRDVVAGHKRITARSLPRFLKALGLKGELRNYFTLLVALEEPELNPENHEAAEIRTRLERIRKRYSARDESARMQTREVYGRRGWLEVFASLGSRDEGASVDEILARCHMPREDCARVLGELTALGVARFEPDSGRYKPDNAHLIFEGLGGDAYFKDFFASSVHHIAFDARHRFKNEDRLFLSSVFSVRRQRLPALKKELRELLTRFVDGSEDPQGDGLARLAVGLIPHGAEAATT